MKFITKIWVVLILCLAGGSAAVMAKPFPSNTGPLKISFFSEGPNAHRTQADWPQGTYRIPDSNVFIADLQGDENLSPAKQESDETGRTTLVGEGTEEKPIRWSDLGPSLALDSEALAQKCLEEILAQEKGRFSPAEEDEKANLKISPYLVFSHVDKGKTRLWVILKVTYGDPRSDRPEWKGRYIASLGLARTYLGENGWTGQGGKLLQHAAEWDMRTALQVMMKDLDGKLRPENSPRQKVKGCWAFYHKALSVDAQILSKGPDKLIVLPMVGDTEYFSGVNILPDDFTEGELADPHAMLK